jgi:hypothetical protein
LLERLAACPALARVECLELNAELDDPTMATGHSRPLDGDEQSAFDAWYQGVRRAHPDLKLKARPQPKALAAKLVGFWRWLAAVPVLVNSTHFTRVRALGLPGGFGPFGYALAVTVLRSGTQSALRALSVARQEIVDRLEDSPHAQFVRVMAALTAEALATAKLPRLERLTLSCTTAGAVRQLTVAPGLSSLKYLNLGLLDLDFPGDATAIREMLATPQWGQLQRLEAVVSVPRSPQPVEAVTGSARVAAVVEAVVRSPSLAGLEALVVRRTECRVDSPEFSPEVAETLAASPHLGALRLLQLDLHTGNFGERSWPELGPDEPRRALGRAVAALLDAPALKGPFVLPQALAQNSRATEWLMTPGAAKLTHLRWVDVTGEGALEALATSPNLTGIRTFDAHWSHGAARDYPILAQRQGNWAMVSTFGDDGVQALIRSRVRETVVSLNLGNADLTDAGVRTLVVAEWPALRYLSLHPNRLTDASLDTLARWPGLAGLIVLEVSPDGTDRRYEFSPAAIRAFGQSPYAANLQFLRITWSGPHDHPEFAQALRESNLTGLRICDLFPHASHERTAYAARFPRLIGECLGRT